MAAKLKKGDKVIVLAGKDKGKTGQIASVAPKDNKAVVEGVNIAVRHTKQSQGTQGGRIAKAMPIDLSNLAIVDRNGKPSRVGFRMEGDRKVRFAKTTGEVI
ncbi:MAG: 50S ribosomal protein L24 [Rhodobacter sp.]|nr:50S ribosomal protein L24 [Rhodobacter sp.]MCA3514458.1 50S ribosomal protein L24 [Rhodobacter sp.]MCA3520364.1 50S ribosomal protein L24 [Rhodobacter sp.]MCA3523157.1 50S ribosomal protein L24 [Rhodobacter sp.]MCA3525817.1 50S ribosomal protein L24 [Rhodobacter sp.]